jgi:AraC-like DNA-binding protein/ligand-binding sensor protein
MPGKKSSTKPIVPRESWHPCWSNAPAPSPPGGKQPSLLEQFMAIIQSQTGWHLSFDDLTGGDTGMHNDIPELCLQWKYQSHHHCRFCAFARRSHAGDMDCIRNKIAVNRIALRRRQGFHGLCHLGLFEIVEPLVYQNTVLGVFFFGSVVLKEQRKSSQARIRRYCRRYQLNSTEYLQQLNQLPVIKAEDIPQYRSILLSVVNLARYICFNAGIRPELYPRKPLAYPYINWRGTPYLVKAVITYINQHLQEPFIVKNIAGHLRCHPDFLSRKFKEHTGINLGNYLQNMRINRAKTLLQNPKINVENAATLAGFSDRSHFSKAFHRVTGQTPREYKQQCQSTGD